MIVTITPSAAEGRIQAPPSKSMAHRLLICAGLSAGTSVISNVDFSDDIMATLDCLRALGAGITCEDSRVIIHGIDPGQVSHPAVLPCRECGSSLRFMIPVCLMSGQEIRLTGSSTLFKRPLNIYEDICREQNLHFEKKENSQFVSGLLFALPLLEEDSTIRLLPPIESRPYIDMTLYVLAQFGIKTAIAPANTPTDGKEVCSLNRLPADAGSLPVEIRVPGRQRYMPRNLEVEGDYSNAAFFEALTLLGGRVLVDGLKEDSLQGDRCFREYFSKLQKGFADVDLSDCPDLGPVLMAAAAALHGGRFTGTKRLAYKESDRGAAMKQELGRFNVRVDLSENEIIVYPGLSRPQQILDGHNDHRIVMSLAVLLSVTGGSLGGAEAVEKSLPDFFDRLKKLGIKMSFSGGCRPGDGANCHSDGHI